MKVWQEVQADRGDGFTFAPGQRYAVLASASKNYSKQQIKDYLAGKGLTATYEWEWGDPIRTSADGKPLFNIDAWIQGLEADTRDNHRWLYGEGNMAPDAKPWHIGRDAPWPFTIYHVAHVMQAVDAPDNAPAPELPPEQEVAVAPPRSAGKLALAALGLGGLALLARGRRRVG